MKLKILLTFYSVAIAISAFSQPSYSFYYKLNGYQGNRAILYQIRGAENIPLDTCIKQLNAFTFYNLERFPVGMYRVKFDDTLFTEVIFNHEDIVMETDANDVLRSMNVIKSLENSLVFDYWKFAISIKDSLLGLNLRRNSVLRNNQQRENAETKDIDKKIARLENENYNYVLRLRNEYPDAFAPKVLYSFQMPSYTRYIEQKGNEPYSSEKLFYLYHFFDNIDFSDARLLNTKIIFTAINDYIKTFATTPSTEVYNDLIDRVLVQTAVNISVHKYAIDLFIKGFDNSIWEEVFIHVIEDYYLKTIVDNPYLGVYYANKITRMKALAIGKVFPELVLKDTSNNLFNVKSVNSKACLLVFYSSDCSHCLETLPKIKDIYDAYKEQSFEVIAVALDSDEVLWKSVIKRYNYNWVSVSDLKGLTGPLYEQFNIWSTPKIYILDKDKIIRFKPNSEDEIHAALLELLQIQN